MATHVSGIAITIKAFLPTGKTLDEQFTALSLVKEAHASGDYSAVLKAANIDEVKAEQKTRRVEEKPPAQPQQEDDKGEDDGGIPSSDIAGLDGAGDDDPRPDFLKKGKRSAE